ncbi:hypothetical protein HOY80DRAFT_1022652 [Tuber brumale]|nr:hypothetical protein HOY80DRAFT_1022652 [Tuber brumale]
MPAVSRQTIEAMLSRVGKRDHGGDKEANDGNGEGPKVLRITPPNIANEAPDITPPSLAHEAANIAPLNTCNRSSHALPEDTNIAPRSHDDSMGGDGRAPTTRDLSGREDPRRQSLGSFHEAVHHV